MKLRIALPPAAALALPALADNYSLPKNAAFEEECGSCHMAYPPQMLRCPFLAHMMNGLATTSAPTPRSTTSAVSPSPTSWRRTRAAARPAAPRCQGQAAAAHHRNRALRKEAPRGRCRDLEARLDQEPGQLRRLPYAGGSRRLQRTFDHHSQVRPIMNSEAKPSASGTCRHASSTGRWSASFATAFVTSESEKLRDIHVVAGYAWPD
jgi:hypothetical protein